MDATEKTPFELPKKLRFKHDQVLRHTVGDKDFTFEPNKVYTDLPANDYLFSIWKQGFFEEILPRNKKQVEASPEPVQPTTEKKPD